MAKACAGASRSGRRARRLQAAGSTVTTIVAALLLLPAVLVAQQQAPPLFRSGTALVTVDVVVRDGSGNVVRGLTASDFTVLEDGKPQSIGTFTFQQIGDRPPAPVTSEVLTGLEARVREAAPAARPPTYSAESFAGHRVLVLLFDLSSLQPEDVQRAVDAGQQYVDTQMSPADLIAVVTIGSRIDVLTDFTGDREAVRTTLQNLAFTDGTATPTAAASTVATDEADANADSDNDATTSDDSGFDTFNNDVRLRALKTLADTLAPIEQKKAVLYFSAGLTRQGQDNQVELRAATNAAVRANVAIYPVDARGLQAIAPGGDATQASGRGTSLFSGQGVQRQFDQLAASQDTLVTLAADTGGRAFTDANDFGEAFARAQRDLSAYYLIGYNSANTTRDGRFRRIEVRVGRKGLRVEARRGYYADRDFAHTNRGDREAQLADQLNAAVSSTDLPIVVGTGWFRQASDRFYVPIALAIPGSAVPVAAAAKKVTLDVRGVVRDEQGRAVGHLKDTLDIAAETGTTLAGRQVLYQSGVTLPPGRFVVKVVVRENATGTIGSFEAPVAVPQLRDNTMKISSVVLSTQLQRSDKATAGNPLVREGTQLLPNLTRVVSRNQTIYFYYEVYDPAVVEAMPEIHTSLAFYRGGIKVYETPQVEHTTVDEPNRRAVVFQFQVPASAFTPGTYTCQVNVIDTVAGRVAFPRLTFAVR